MEPPRGVPFGFAMTHDEKFWEVAHHRPGLERVMVPDVGSAPTIFALQERCFELTKLIRHTLRHLASGRLRCKPERAGAVFAPGFTRVIDWRLNIRCSRGTGEGESPVTYATAPQDSMWDATWR